MKYLLPDVDNCLNMIQDVVAYSNGEWYNNYDFIINRGINGRNANMKLVWIGPRKSDIKYAENMFYHSVTLYGDGQKDNDAFCLTKNDRINHNHITAEQTDFMVKHELELLADQDDISFMAYNPNLIYDCNEKVVKKTLCLNSQSLMTRLDSKISFRKMIEGKVSSLHSELVEGKNCTITNLNKVFPNAGRWIVQSDIASGGFQTFVISAENETDVRKHFKDDQQYLVSPYYVNNIPVNIHAIIYEEEILLSPGSIQMMEEDRGRLLYRGADYIEYRNIDDETRKQFENDVLHICKLIQAEGYRGVLGIDSIIVDGVSYILEINNRFQASTILLNRALNENNMPSVQQLNLEAFTDKKSKLVSYDDFFELQIDYSIYTYINNKSDKHIKHIYNSVTNGQNQYVLIEDGYCENQTAEDDAYLYRVIFNENICSLDCEGFCRTHPNVREPGMEWLYKVRQKDFYALKISLINQGITLSEDVKNYLNMHGGMRWGVYYAVDLELNNGCIVNSPLYTKFAQLSPFSVQLLAGGLFLFYYSYNMGKVNIKFEDPIARMHTVNNIPLKEMCLVATDRLRIQNSSFCTFKENGVACRFCEVQHIRHEFSIEDILESVDTYFQAPKEFRHVLIGGLSNIRGKEKDNILRIIAQVRKYSSMPIYLMILPPEHIEDIAEYVDAGVTEIAFNLECFDRVRAGIYMPGKGRIGLKQYEDALKYAVEKLGKKGAVRSAFVVGLEPDASLLSGVRYLCELGVTPIFSAFRPIPGTDMEHVVPYSNERLLGLVKKAEEICDEYGIKLGPECIACQNNTLSFDIPS